MNKDYYVEPALSVCLKTAFSFHTQETLHPKTVAKAHMHADMEILHCRRGCFRVLLNERPFMLNEGDFILIDANMIHRTEALTADGAAYGVIKLPHSLLYSLAQSGKDMKAMSDIVLQGLDAERLFTAGELKNTQIPAIFLEIEQECAKEDLGYEYAVKVLIEQLFLWILRRRRLQGKSPHPTVKQDAKLRLRDCLIELWENYTAPLSATHMAAKCYMSYSTFAMLFRHMTGYSYTNYIAFIRILKAKELLASTTLSVTEVGETVGFSTTSYFIEQFRAREGTTPARYRQMIMK